MKFVKYNDNKSVTIPPAVLTVCGLDDEGKLEMAGAKGAVILSKSEMTAMEMVHTILALTDRAGQLMRELTDLCGSCEGCTDGHCTFRDADIDELIRPAVTVPDWAREEADIAPDAKLDCHVDEGSGVITVCETFYDHDLSDIPAELLEALRKSGCCLSVLEDILGNSGQGKSYLMKLLILNLLESGKSIITLDAEHEQQEMCEAVGGCFADLMAGKYIINVLEPKCWDDGGDPDDTAAPEAFRKSTLLAQHISFLKDFFRAYKDFSDAHIDTIEIMLSKLYGKWGITERTNFRRMRSEDYPILSDLYDLIEAEYKSYDMAAHQLYTEQILREVLLGLHSMCKGADAQFFNGHTNITSSRFLVFGVKGLLGAAKNVRNAMLFNILSFLSDKLLTEGNTVAALDELYIWLSNPTAIEYIRNCLKRVRKKESAMLLASQNLEDFDQEGIREMTKPLFSIPPHQFLFNAGSIDKRSYMEMLQLDEAEYNLIKFPQRGVCLYKCGNERYLLEVHAPAYKEKLFGTAGGR